MEPATLAPVAVAWIYLMIWLVIKASYEKL
jgi:hypothetical protein